MSLALLAVLSLAPQTTWVVDALNGPGTDFIDLPPAVVAAAHGDTILVRAGSYSTFQASSKALTIRGAGATATTLMGIAMVSGVPAGSVFHVYGATFVPTGQTVLPTLTVRGTSTVVVLSDCVLVGGTYALPLAYQYAASHGLEVDAAQVFAARCEFLGGSIRATLSLAPATCGDGVRATSGAFMATECLLRGGDGFAYKWFAPVAGHGLRVGSAVASMDSCSCFGGRAITTPGNGIQVDGPVARVRASGSSLDILQGGANYFANGTVGVAVAVVDATSIVLVHDSVQLVAAAPGHPTTVGPVIRGAPELPRVRVSVGSQSMGEIPAASPFTVTVDSALPLAPILFGISPQPEVSTALVPLVLGDVVVPVAAFCLGAVLDGSGRFSRFCPGSIPPAFFGQPVFGQVAVLDIAANQIRVSNLDLHLYSN